MSSTNGNSHTVHDGTDPTIDATEGSRSFAKPTEDPPPHDLKPVPGVDASAVQREVASEVCVPETIRGQAPALGEAIKNVPPGIFERIVQKIYTSIAGVRSGAVSIPAEREKATQRKISKATKPAISEIRERGKAAERKARRRVKYGLAQSDEEIQELQTKLTDIDSRLAEAEVEVVAARTAHREEQDAKATVLNSPRLARAGTSQTARRIAFVVELAASIALLSGAVANEFVVQNPLIPYLIAAGISTPMLLGANLAGRYLGAAAIPERALVAAAVGTFLTLMVAFIPALDDLRDGDGTTVLTLATVIVAYVAFGGSCLQTLVETADDDLEPSTRLGLAVSRTENLRAERERLAADLVRTGSRRADLVSEVNRLLDQADDATADGVAREVAGVEAAVEEERISRNERTALQQEQHSATWAVNSAIAAHRNTRATDIETPHMPVPEADADQVGVRRFWRRAVAAAAATLASAASFSLALDSAVPLGLGTALIALLALRGEAGGDATAHPRPASDPLRIDLQVSEALEDYFRQPDHMSPGHTDGGPSDAERQ